MSGPQKKQEYQYIKLPDGSYGKFRAEASDDEIRTAITRDFPDAFKKTETPATQAPSFAERHPIISGAGDLAIGAAKGLGNTLNNVGSMLIPDRLVKAVGGHVPTEQEKAGYFEPTNTAQKIGKTAEQVGEFLVPTGAEAEAASLAGKLAPKIARYAVPASRIATDAVETGLRSKAQGGNFKEGAALGAGGAVATPIARKAAEGLAEIAVAPGKRLLKSIPEDVNIGKTVLENSKGYTPRTIAGELGEKTAQHSAALEDALGEAGRAGKKIPLAPARKVVSDEIPNAVLKNAPNYIRDVDKVADQLNTQYGPTGEAIGRISDAVSPKRARDLRQGVDLTIGSWNPEAQSAIKPLQKRVYGAITGKIHEVVPEAAKHDAAMTSLIPAQEAAANTAFNPSVARNVFNRIARPTGALAGGIAGGYEGYKRGGAEGALLGGTIGLTVPEIITSPTGQMIAARSINSPTVGRFVKGLTLQGIKALDADKESPAQ